uniref:Enoyl reductase (ER) domain-containing protein n=1 Tax=Globisporangium ultimum (strain ATCC 200006 / CBS 805.95 / DAOM BR144) TaxID=431595 RepID=K3WWA2_GLOUD
MPSFKRIEVHTKSSNFRAATRIVEEAQVPAPSAGTVIVRNHFVGINATDVNVTNGAYSPQPPPFGCGLDGVGVVVSVGEGVTNVQVNDAVTYKKIGAFAEYVEVNAATLIKVPAPVAEVLPLLVCGSSGSIALEEVGEMKSGETVLVTAAAGGTGQIVVQLAKLAGNHVIGTTSSDEKAELLKSLGCDRVINYTKEDVNAVLKAEYPKGINLVFESVGEDMLRAAVNNIAVHGRIIAFGYISGYQSVDKSKQMLASDMVPTLLFRSASLRGFISSNHMGSFAAHIEKLLGLINEGKLKIDVDPTPFNGLESIPEAIDYMFAKKNIGKLVVKLV